MPKSKFTTFDIAAEVAALRRSVLGCWLANVYDLDSRTYAFKFNKPSGAVARDADTPAAASDAESEKIHIIIESGNRFHRTKYERAKNDAPSKFNAKLRMHVRTKRLNDVRQFGRDRAVDFTFGGGDTECHIIVEFYGQGNIILTDKNYTVLTLLRTHRDDAKGVKILGNHTYPLDRFRAFKQYEREDVVCALASGMTVDDVAAADGDADAADEKTDGAGTRSPGTIREALARAFGYAPPFAEHVALTAGIPNGASASLPFDNAVRDAYIDALTTAVQGLESWFEGVTTGAVVATPVVTTKMDSKADGSEAIEIFDDFSPFPLKQNEGKPVKEFPMDGVTDLACAFDHVVDEYFTALESQSGVLARRKVEAQAITKLEKTLKDVENRAAQLELEREKEEQRAVLIEYNLEAVDRALDAVNSALASGMSWTELEMMIKEERRLGNPVASMIKSLDLEKNQITITLANHLDDVGEEKPSGGKAKRVTVVVDLGLSAHANASVHFAAKKKHAEKFGKTMEAQSKAVAIAEAKAKAAIERAGNSAAISRARQTLWFEKFNWFVTSENCLVLQAKDATQAEMLISKYMLPGDAFVHADVAQAPVTLVKPPPGDYRAVPSYSLTQAGAAVMCRSSAWTSRAVTSAWWTTPDCVSKIAALAGDKLPPGVVNVARADKQFLPPAQLVMGFGLMFVVSEKNVDAHKNDRLVRSDFDVTLEQDEGDSDDDDDGGDVVEIKRRDRVEPSDDGDGDGDGDDDKDDEDVDIANKLASSNLQSINDTDYALANKHRGDAHATKQTASPRMSAKERRAQKKKGKKGGKASDDDDDDDNFVDPLAQLSSPTKAGKAAGAGKPLPRGKAAKLKRAKAKYGDQDDEDRELAMAFLGADGTKKSSKSATDGQTTVTADVTKPEAPTAPTPAPAPFKQRDAEKRARREAKAAEDAEDVVADDDNDERGGATDVTVSVEERLKADAERVSFINRIVGAPFKEDDIEYALPVCAPIAATNALKYRMKVTPGSQKKGKAAKVAMEILMRAPFASKPELDAMRALADADVAHVFPSGCKVSYPPGALKSMQNTKKSSNPSRGSKKKR